MKKKPRFSCKNADLFFLKLPSRGVEPLQGNDEPIANKGLTENTNGSLCASLCKPLQNAPQNPACNPAENQSIDPLLNSLYSIWPNLPQHIKEAIKSLINTHTGNENETIKPK
ncbi:MAG: hypothetical protein A2Y10_15310 [Planctomycetes bacterium GWF2_41_51]|nr:MAG: hypothetical protein A2Y10_15310 [Planctomycetes bacterium GWF2_41_51]